MDYIEFAGHLSVVKIQIALESRWLGIKHEHCLGFGAF